MAIAVGINGYGRIGRAFHRQALLDPSIRVVAVNSQADSTTLAHLFKYDSIYGRLDKDVIVTTKGFSVDGQEVAIYQETVPGAYPWRAHDVHLVIEATGKFKDRSATEQHLRAGVAGVILSCPPKDATIPSIVMGVNDHQLDLNQAPIISNASCTTNALAPMVRVLDEGFGVEFCSFRTIHAVTDSQHMLDNSDKDPRRARAAMESIIPTATGASAMIGRLFPHLNGRVHGLAYRVPTRTVSSLDVCVRLKRLATVESINRRFMEEASRGLRNILSISREPLVSIDFKGDPHSVIVDLPLTTDCGNGFFHLVGWYDNEWGYSARLIDLVRLLAQRESERRSAPPRKEVTCVTAAMAST